MLEGDYTGPAGAWRVLREPGLDVAVLETARGGILLRGMACQSNDVSVMTNISGDHLGLARRPHRRGPGRGQERRAAHHPARPAGSVLNADDPLVRGQAAGSARLRSSGSRRTPRTPPWPRIATAGGRAVLAEDGWLVEARGEEAHRIAPLDEIPITFGGQARHMIENVLCAAGVALALGVDREEIAAGLRELRRGCRRTTPAASTSTTSMARPSSSTTPTTRSG